MRRLADELARTVDFYNITHAINPIKPTIPILLSGKPAIDAKTVELNQSNTEYPVEVFKSAIKAPSDFPLIAYADNLGLALKGTRRNAESRENKTRFYDIDIDLLEGKRRVEIKHTPKDQILLPVGLIIALILLIMLSVVKGQAHTERLRLQGEVDALTNDLQRSRIMADQAAATEATILTLSTETAALAQKNSRSFLKMLTMPIS